LADLQPPDDLPAKRAIAAVIAMLALYVQNSTALSHSRVRSSPAAVLARAFIFAVATCTSTSGPARKDADMPGTRCPKRYPSRSIPGWNVPVGMQPTSNEDA